MIAEFSKSSLFLRDAHSTFSDVMVGADIKVRC